MGREGLLQQPARHRQGNLEHGGGLGLWAADRRRRTERLWGWQLTGLQHFSTGTLHDPLGGVEQNADQHPVRLGGFGGGPEQPEVAVAADIGQAEQRAPANALWHGGAPTHELQFAQVPLDLFDRSGGCGPGQRRQRLQSRIACAGQAGQSFDRRMGDLGASILGHQAYDSGLVVWGQTVQQPEHHFGDVAAMFLHLRHIFQINMAVALSICDCLHQALQGDVVVASQIAGQRRRNRELQVAFQQHHSPHPLQRSSLAVRYGRLKPWHDRCGGQQPAQLSQPPAQLAAGVAQMAFYGGGQLLG